MEKKVFQIIDAKNGKYYLSEDFNKTSYSWNRTLANDFLFNGQRGATTFKDCVIELNEIPTLVEKIYPAYKETLEYRLSKEWEILSQKGFAISLVREDYRELSDKEQEFYEPFYKDIPERKESIEFELQWIEYDWRNKGSQELQIGYEGDAIEFNLLSYITTPALFRVNEPCKFTRVASYMLIKNHLEKHMDKNQAWLIAENVAKEDDLRFRPLKVNKKIAIEPYEDWQTPLYFQKKPKKVKVLVNARSIELLKIDHEHPFQFEGNNYADLVQKKDAFLEELIAIVNEPLEDCRCCKGRGVVVEGMQENVQKLVAKVNAKKGKS